MGTTKRQSNLELLRIVSMILIVMSHCDDIFGLYPLYTFTTGVNKIITDWLHVGGQIGVGCFVLISGYFMIGQSITAKKIFKIAGEVWFYTIGLWAVWVVSLICTGQFSLRGILGLTKLSFLPILFGQYWFVTAYIMLMLLSPFLNKLINAMEKKEYRALLATLIIIVVVLYGGIPNLFPKVLGDRLIPVIVVYFIAGYLRRFGDAEKKGAAKHILIAGALYVALLLVCYVITFAGNVAESEEIMSLRYFYRDLNSPFVVLISTELFIGFNKLDMKYSKAVNYIAGCTFGVYLIHANQFMTDMWLPKIFPIYKLSNSALIFAFSVLGVIIIYVGCTLIDILRRLTVDKLWNKFLDGGFSVICERVSKWVNSITERWDKTNTGEKAE